MDSLHRTLIIYYIFLSLTGEYDHQVTSLLISAPVPMGFGSAIVQVPISRLKIKPRPRPPQPQTPAKEPTNSPDPEFPPDPDGRSGSGRPGPREAARPDDIEPSGTPKTEGAPPRPAPGPKPPIGSQTDPFSGSTPPRPAPDYDTTSSERIEDKKIDESKIPNDEKAGNGSGDLDQDCGLVRTEEVPFPWHVSIAYTAASPPTFFCGGVVLTSRWMLTSARCALSGRQTSLGLSSSGSSPSSSSGTLYLVMGQSVGSLRQPHEQWHTAERVVIHPEYNPLTLANDLALLRTRNQVLFDSGHVSPVCFSAPSVTSNMATNLKTSGWTPWPDRQLASALIYQVNQDCFRYYGKLDGQTVLCGTEMSGSWCTTNPGSPLVSKVSGVVAATGGRQSPVERVSLVGLASFGQEGCARRGWPQIFTKLTASYIEWIQRVIA